jgi:hypothetical protein
LDADSGYGSTVCLEIGTALSAIADLRLRSSSNYCGFDNHVEGFCRIGISPGAYYVQAEYHSSYIILKFVLKKRNLKHCDIYDCNVLKTKLVPQMATLTYMYILIYTGADALAVSSRHLCQTSIIRTVPMREFETPTELISANGYT